jgi:signal transduction histidine kinase
MKSSTIKQDEQSSQSVHPQWIEGVHFNTRGSWWRKPVIGYLLSLPLIGLALLVALMEQHLLANLYFFEAPFFLAVMIVALLWSTRPALIAVILSTLILDYFYVPPPGVFTFHTLDGLLQLLPFLVSGAIIAIITAQRESARRRALLNEQKAQVYASELKQMNVQLEQANQLKDQFLSLASHELKTPITTVNAYSQLLLRRLSKQQQANNLESIAPTLERIIEQTNRLSILVNDLLDLGSIRSGKMELRLTSCDLGEICRSIVEDQRLLTERSIELTIPTTPLILEVDCDRISQVVINLVQNAVKYSPESSPVGVHVSHDTDRAIIQVSDDGPGVSEELRTRIFEAFYRTPEVQASSQRGLGLGLAICREIVERHGGRIRCDSNKGRGSVFVVELLIRH